MKLEACPLRCSVAHRRRSPPNCSVVPSSASKNSKSHTSEPVMREYISEISYSNGSEGQLVPTQSVIPYKYKIKFPGHVTLTFGIKMDW